MPVRVRQCRPETGGGDFLRSGAAWMDTQNNVCKPEAEPEAYQIKRIRGVTFPSIAGIKPGPRY